LTARSRRSIGRSPGSCSDRAELGRLLTLPGVSFVTACALLAAIGDARRFPGARRLVSYLRARPAVHQSGFEPARHGRISEQGPGETRQVLVEVA
jgi:transposase